MPTTSLTVPTSPAPLTHETIQRTIDQLASRGGGTVVVPPGRYLCGTLHLRSNITLHLQRGAELLGSPDASLFPVICPTPYGNLPGQIQAVIWAEKCTNVAITGEGTIDGQGVEPIQGDVAAAIKFRPCLVFFRDCTDVSFSAVWLKNSAFWTLHLQRCRRVKIRGLTITAVQGRINTDGIDPDGCTDVDIRDCRITTGDDAIVIKSTEGDPCERITVDNCTLSSYCAAIKIGTEAIGPIRDVRITNCIVRDTDVALALYMKDGSVYERMTFANLDMEARNPFPLLIDITPRYYREPKIGAIRDITIENVSLRAAGRAYIEGRPESPIENLTLRNFTWQILPGGQPFGSVIKPNGARRVDLDPAAPSFAGLPYQFIVRHARGLTLDRVKVVDTRQPPSADRGLLHATAVSKKTDDVTGPGDVVWNG